MMKIRRSWKGNNRLVEKDPLAIEPPKKVIRALYDYRARGSEELSFSKGDFFHVIGREEDQAWYEVCNPAVGARGYVPVKYFEELGKTVNNRDSDTVSAIDFPATSPTSNEATSPSGHRLQPLFGVVLYDFSAERPDELTAKAGEAIIVIARSNHEWLVAKPIGRLGGPGLIPISYVELRDMKTGAVLTDQEGNEASVASLVPLVDEWKQAASSYKKSSIPLGRFEDDDSVSSAPETPTNMTNSSGHTSSASNALRESTELACNDRLSTASSCDRSSRLTRDSRISLSNEPTVSGATVESFVHAKTQYWYLLRAVMDNGQHRNLCRYYEDFYNLQLALLEAFPDEAGRSGSKRVIPYMPGPVDEVDDVVSEQRALDLDVYVKELCRLPANILSSWFVRRFFFLEPGDVGADYATSVVPKVVARPFITYNNQSPPSPTRLNTATGSRSSANGSIKVKVRAGEDLFAFRLSSGCSYDDFCDRLRRKLDRDWTTLHYQKDKNELMPLQNDLQFQLACTLINPLLVIVDGFISE
ncbi:hypothetical protein SJAG_01794 [Schizosaccharomyces japonicus yFS275]|uniref:Scaffold protein Scd2 n=1 Tax=Schizosaccharomyces japonicus (strain yFS275 / FY16936) TaxID=402676 RepID=B6JYX1_SCHJY|nr:hypothetical protein SJAG_01794 [Schizosaccharomyces japonicus yFS275]EEB06739.1 hypothetical protein SJAG_01794 [Schizosaccharomyces japonicus yFS275]